MLVWKMFPEFCLYKIPMRVRILLYALWKPHSSWSILLIRKVICAKSTVFAWKFVKQCNYWPSSTPNLNFNQKKNVSIVVEKNSNYLYSILWMEKHLKWKTFIEQKHYECLLCTKSVPNCSLQKWDSLSLSSLTSCPSSSSCSFDYWALGCWVTRTMWVVSSTLDEWQLELDWYVQRLTEINEMPQRKSLHFFGSEGEMRWPSVKPNTSSVIDHNCTTRTHL